MTIGNQVFNRAMCGASLLRALRYDDEADAIIHALKELDRRPATVAIEYPPDDSPRLGSHAAFITRNVVPSIVIESDGYQVRMRCVVESGKWSDLTPIP